MEKEQLEKKLAWLDDEHRQASETLNEFGQRLFEVEESLKENGTGKPSDKAEVVTLNARISELEGALSKQIMEAQKSLQALEKQQSKQGKAVDAEKKGFSKVLDDFRKEAAQLQSIRKSLNAHDDKLSDILGRVASLEESIKTVLKGEERRSQLAKRIGESSKQDARRLTQLHSQVTELLPRLEEAAKKTEGILLAQRKVDKRVDELAAHEEKRQAEHDEALEKSALAQSERAKQWKEWEKRFDLMEQHSSEVATRLKDIETTDLAVKRAQRSFDELVEKINRRVNELGEMQRLGDQRFRQEWSTFQADTQKRWASLMLNHEEQQREGAREQGKLADQVTQLEDSLREVGDIVQHLREQSEHQLQTLLEMARDTLAEHERFLNNSR
jgi:chromosome segregation ATPase